MSVKRIMRYLVLTPNICYDILRGFVLSSLDIQMLIMPDTKWIEKIPLKLVNFLDGPLSLGLQRNKKFALSTAEAEYVDVNSCCAQLL
jgi:hypothetical protein